MYWTDCLCAAEQVKGRIGGRGSEVGPHQSMQLYFHDCVCLPWMRRSSDPPPPPCGILHYLFAVSRSADPKYTPPVTITHRTHTHMHTLFGTYDSPFLTHTHLLRRVCSPRLARPLPAARTHIVSHHRPPPSQLIPYEWPPGSRAFSETSSHFLFHMLPD